ncbi:hypothetical protein LX97_03042 [Nonlabens dokdonensis]|uniref:Adhesin domain-containing protein n=2 Tax=Nonlabens dokdonensis TaxID=328515 RepID=L7WDZ1_NONDD|nr:hypothetical protein [Nonlabens dokdonensis]AGC78161.1 hypothetical protein DDD_3034 [Nonlabens dokdonensis DSW-6]PZX37946.1 hypothetical protein LX97_03042 [Nonlabens dokdonensis]
MKQLYKLSILLFLLPLLAVAGPGGKYTKSKKINKTFTVNKSCMVEIENSFGNVTITTWDQPTVSIEVTVEVSGDNEDSVNKQLREIDVDFEASASRVSARTDAESQSSGGRSLWNSFFGSDNNQNSNMKINYIVKMPVTASLDISNDYGTVKLDRLEGKANISCDFGRLDIGQLLAENNELRFDYTNNSHIDYMKSGIIRADFSGFELHGTEKVEFKGDYTKAKIHDVKELNFNSDFSTVESGKAVNIIGRGDYSTIKLGLIQDKVNLNTDFGSINIDELGSNFKEATVKSEYTGIKINFHSDAAFKFDIDTEFASIKLDDNLTITRSENDTTDKERSGYYRQENNNSIISIRSSFGGVSLKKK